MPRTYKPTGGKPGAPKGNTNAVTHGAHSEIERAETLRAHSALRGAKALAEAMKLEEEAAAMAAAEENDPELQRHDAMMSKMWRAARAAPNFRGLLANIVRNRLAFEWIGLFPNEVAPDWIYAWLDEMPALYMSPALNDCDDIVPGVPDPSREEEEGGGGKKPETTPPPSAPRSLWNELFPCQPFGSAVSFDESLPGRLFELVPQFGSRLNAEGYLKWKIKQLAVHQPVEAGKTGVNLEPAATGFGFSNPVPWRARRADQAPD